MIDDCGYVLFWLDVWLPSRGHGSMPTPMPISMFMAVPIPMPMVMFAAGLIGICVGKAGGQLHVPIRGGG